jgi:phosphatidylglycerophosphate synthase
MRYTRRYNLAPAIGFGLVSTGGMAWLAGTRIEAGAAYPVAAAAVFALMMTAVTAVAGDRHPYQRFGPANYVTMIRVVLVALVAALIGRPATPEVLWSVIGLAALMAALDGLDGWLARRTRMASEFGARFDMETDALLILVLSILVWQHEKAGPWVLLCGLMRYGFVAAGWLLPWLAQPLRSTRRGKTVAVCQLAGLSVALAPTVPVPISSVAAALTLSALAWSFAIDVRWLSRQYRLPSTSCPASAGRRITTPAIHGPAEAGHYVRLDRITG